jgi:hypothetical protein
VPKKTAILHKRRAKLKQNAEKIQQINWLQGFFHLKAETRRAAAELRMRVWRKMTCKQAQVILQKPGCPMRHRLPN